MSLMESTQAEALAADLAEVLACHGVFDANVLPAHDRIVVHLPLDSAERFVNEAHVVRSASTRIPLNGGSPNETPDFDPFY